MSFSRRHYSKLVRIARRWTDSPSDLVHHTYLRCVDKRLSRGDNENALGYFVKAMYNEATRGKFKELYHVTDAEPQRTSQRKRLDKSHPTRADATASSTASAGSIEPSSLYTCKGGIWLTYLDGLALENRPFIAHYTSPEKS